MEYFKWRGGDRRRQPRGGRREEDAAGSAPQVLLIDADSDRRSIVCAILANRGFAVTPLDSLADAVAAVHESRPELVVALADDVQTLRDALPDETLPLLAVADATARDEQTLIDAIRVVFFMKPQQ